MTATKTITYEHNGKIVSYEVGAYALAGKARNECPKQYDHEFRCGDCRTNYNC